MSRWLAVLPIVAVAAIPAYAAQQLSEKEARQAADSVASAFSKAAQAKDAAVVAAMFTSDAAVASPYGIKSGRAAIEKGWEDNFMAYSPEPNKIEQAVPADSGAVALIGDWSKTFHRKDGDKHLKGYLGQTLVHEGGAWKIRMETWNETKE